MITVVVLSDDEEDTKTQLAYLLFLTIHSLNRALMQQESFLWSECYTLGLSTFQNFESNKLSFFVNYHFFVILSNSRRKYGKTVTIVFIQMLEEYIKK